MKSLITLFGALAFGVTTHAADRPDIVFIIADDLGWADVGFHGGNAPTPNLDRLAREGVRFTQASAPAPVCSPTRAAIMTGHAPARLHMTIWHEAATRPVEDRALIPPAAVATSSASEPCGIALLGLASMYASSFASSSLPATSMRSIVRRSLKCCRMWYFVRPLSGGSLPPLAWLQPSAATKQTQARHMSGAAASRVPSLVRRELDVDQDFIGGGQSAIAGTDPSPWKSRQRT